MVRWGIDMREIFVNTFRGDGRDSYARGIHLASARSKEFLYEEQRQFRAFHELAVSTGAYDVFTENDTHSNIWYDTFRSFTHNPVMATFMLPHVRPGHYLLPAIDRINFMPEGFDIDYISVDLLQSALREDGILRRADIEELDAQKAPLLEYAALLYIYNANFSGRGPSSTMVPMMVRELTRETMAVTKLLHTRAEWPWRYGFLKLPVSPFILLIAHGSVFDSIREVFSEWRRDIERILLCWLEDVVYAGLDLLEYGRREKQLFLEKGHAYRGHAVGWGCYREVYWRLEDFTYGSDPKDWRFHWGLGCEELAGRFWKTMDNPPLHIPGAWVEDDMESYSSLEPWSESVESDSEAGEEASGWE